MHAPCIRAVSQPDFQLPASSRRCKPGLTFPSPARGGRWPQSLPRTGSGAGWGRSLLRHRQSPARRRQPSQIFPSPVHGGRWPKAGWGRSSRWPYKPEFDIHVFFRPPPAATVSLASAASEPLSVSAESGQRPLRLWRWSNERRVRSTTLAVRLARAGAKLLATALWLALRAACGVQIGNPCRFSRPIHGLEHARLARALGVAAAAPPTARFIVSLSAIHGLARSKNKHCSSRRQRAGCAPTGPLGCGERMQDQPAGWPAGCGPVRRRPMDGPSANPGVRERTRSAWMREGRIRGVAFSLVTFSWPLKRKSHARPGGGRKKAGMPT